MNSLRQHYHTTIVPQLKANLKLANDLAVPRLTKITLNTSSPDFFRDEQLRLKAIDWLSVITGQTPKLTRAKKSIASFNIREGDIVGLSVSLHGERMYDFFQKLIHIVLPPTKDFQGLKTTSFDSRGNYTLGLPEQIIFPEVEYDKIGKIQGLEITISTSAVNPQHALALLSALGFPFAKDNTK